jgi:hypothetical protein
MVVVVVVVVKKGRRRRMIVELWEKSRKVEEFILLD